MRERKTVKWGGWLVAVGSLVLAGVISISGAPRPESPSKATAAAASVRSADSNGAGLANADTDVFEMQLD